MYTKKFQIGKNIVDYEIYENLDLLLNNLNSFEFDSYFLVYDPTILSDVVDKFSNYFKVKNNLVLVPFAITEKTKNFSTLGQLLENLLTLKITRNSCLLALGGGTLGNMVGLAAGLLYRGINFIHIPTTILACSDSVLSLKQGINLLKSKNIIGMYNSPLKVMISPELFVSLPNREISAGYAEFVKNLIIVIPDEIDKFETLNFEEATKFDGLCLLINKSIEAKEKLILNDEHEKNTGILLEYGHTVGHSLEMMFADSLRHGEGVAFGMLVAGLISNKMGYFNESELKIQYDLLEKIGIIEKLKKFFQTREINMNELTDHLLFDNKRGHIACRNDEIAMVIMSKFGEPLLTNGLPIVNIKLDLVIECVKLVYKELIK